MKRYRVGEFVEPPIEERDGGWVRYSDHVAALKEARAAAFKEALDAVTRVHLACGATGSADFQEGIRNGVILGANHIRDVLRATIEAAANTEEGGGDG